MPSIQHLLGFAISLVLLGNGCATPSPSDRTIKTIKIVAFNDFHGQLESPDNLRRSSINPLSADDVTLGGADWLAGYVAALKRQNPDTVVVSAGDLIGASPLISALFHDEATIETMNRLGLEFNALGNHEFDKGKDELLRMQYGGCHPSGQQTCRGADVGTPTTFEGAKSQFLAANVVETTSGKYLFPPYAIKEIGGVWVGFIGMTLKETPSIVAPSGVAGLAFRDEAASVNTLVPELRARGAEAIVVLIHQGGTVPVQQSLASINQCHGSLKGSPLAAIVNQLHDAVDLVISGHTHQAYNCHLANQRGRLIPVTSANAQGRVLTDIDLTIDSATGEVTDVKANNIVVDHNNSAVTPDAGIKTLVDRYKALSLPVAYRTIGSIGTGISRIENAAGESALGDMLADVQLAASKRTGFGEAVAAFLNPGSIRADLSYASSEAGEGDGQVTYAEAFAVQPFGNNLVTMTLSGAQIHTLLEQQFTGCTEGYPAGAPSDGQPFDRILQVSKGFSYQWHEKSEPCHHVDPTSITINGVQVDPAARYRVSVNDFLADGGDQFYLLRQGGERLGGVPVLDALEQYFIAHPAISPEPQNRIRRLP